MIIAIMMTSKPNRHDPTMPPISEVGTDEDGEGLGGGGEGAAVEKKRRRRIMRGRRRKREKKKKKN